MHLPRAIDPMKNTAALVVRQQRGRRSVIDGQPFLNGRRLIVFPCHESSMAAVALALALGWHAPHVVVLAAPFADPPTGEPIHQQRFRRCEIHRAVQWLMPSIQHAIEPRGLAMRSRKPIQHEASPARVRQARGHDFNDQRIGNEPPVRHVALNPLAQRSLSGDFMPKNLTGREMWHAKPLVVERCQRSFPSPWRA